MAKATWRIVALSALVGAVAPLFMAVPARAQVVIGGSGQPDVIVNWSVLDSLGQQPSLADMIKDDLPGRQTAAPPATLGRAPSRATAAQGPVFKPYQPGKATVVARPAKVKPAKVAAASKPAKVKPAAVAEDVPAPAVAPEPTVEPAPQAAVPAKPATPAKPQVAEIEPAKPAEPAKPVEITKPAEPAKPQVAETEPAKPAEVAKPAEPTPPAVAVAPPAAVPAAPQPQAATAMLAPVPPPLPVIPPQVASLPSEEPPAVSGGDTISLVFSPDEAKLNDRARDSLAALVKRMQKDEDLNLQLLAYASGDDSSASKARRLSLSRALEVRKVLLDKGVRSTRIEVRALGNKLDGRGPADRVDAVLVGR